MRKTKSTVVALSTVAALLATGGVAAAVATDDDPASSGASQAVAHSQAQEAKKAEKQKDRKAGKDGKRKHKHKRIAKHAPKGDGAKLLCKRAPKIDKRIDKIQRRLDGGLRTRGSIDRLEKRVENARKAGHGPVADFLNGRLEDRRGHKSTLKDREDDLKKLRAFCATFEKNEDKGTEKGGSEKSGGENAEG